MTTTIPHRTVEDDLRARIHEWVHAGFGTREDVLDWANDLAEDLPGAPGLHRVEELVDEAWRRREAELARAPRSTDTFARLSAAFIALEAEHVLGRMDFADCAECAHAGIRHEPGADTSRGYVFFHQGDTQQIASGVLHLSFGGFRSDPADIAARVVAALRSHGVRAEWDGDPASRIRVDVTEWRKPLPRG